MKTLMFALAGLVMASSLLFTSCSEASATPTIDAIPVVNGTDTYNSNDYYYVMNTNDSCWVGDWYWDGDKWSRIWTCTNLAGDGCSVGIRSKTTGLNVALYTGACGGDLTITEHTEPLTGDVIIFVSGWDTKR